ncbi:hypothetical protein DPMN_154073 [Dreissena polymorpha]|uniref:Uncharacterized protein n=1 Tax=Dreissena polymorpha TaxID=45954 RepID=A0A9D4FKG4_DREPO|nr:hypothetical protein DPMN_154073 [Dreissena polymorpha]
MENYAPPSSIGVHVRLTCDVSLCCIVGDCGANDFPMVKIIGASLWENRAKPGMTLSPHALSPVFPDQN